MVRSADLSRPYYFKFFKGCLSTNFTWSILEYFVPYVIDNSRKSQQSLIVTLLDLGNAFGKVHHNLIDCFLEYRHAPEGIRKIVKNLYYCFETSVLTYGFVTDLVHIEKSVFTRELFQPIDV